LNEAIVPGMPPLKLACGIRLSGFADGKYCDSPGSTFVRSFASFAAWSNALVYWCDQFTPTVNSANVVELNVCRSVFT
jgi:hypothetical protein